MQKRCVKRDSTPCFHRETDFVQLFGVSDDDSDGVIEVHFSEDDAETYDATRVFIVVYPDVGVVCEKFASASYSVHGCGR